MDCTGSRLDCHGNSKPRQQHQRRRSRLIKDPRARNSKLEPHPNANKDLGYQQVNTANIASKGLPPLTTKHRTKDHEKQSEKKKKDAPAASNKNKQKTGNVNGDGDDDDYNADERMIGLQPGSPSFRVYFNDNGEGEGEGAGEDSHRLQC